MSINAAELERIVPTVSSERRTVRLLTRPELDVPVTRVARPARQESQIAQAWIACRFMKTDITVERLIAMLQIKERSAARAIGTFATIGLIRLVRREKVEGKKRGRPWNVWEVV